MQILLLSSPRIETVICFFFYFLWIVDSSHHITPTSAVSLVVSVPLSTATLSGVNLPSNTNTAATIQQIPTIKSFAKIPDIPPVNHFSFFFSFLYDFVDFSFEILFCCFVYFRLRFFVCRLNMVERDPNKSISYLSEYYYSAASRFTR